MDLPDLGKLPISEKAPSGQDVRYEPDFDALSQEISKLGSPTADSPTDWKKVIKLSTSILSTQSKHLQVATYYCYAMMKTEEMDGLFKGIHVLRDLLENFWDSLFPPVKRMKGRRGIIEWWVEKTGDYLSNTQSVVWNKEKRDQLLDNIGAVDVFLGENMEDAPLLRSLVNQLKSTIEVEKLEIPDETPTGASDTTPSMEEPSSSSATSLKPLGDAESPSKHFAGSDVTSKRSTDVESSQKDPAVSNDLSKTAGSTNTSAQKTVQDIQGEQPSGSVSAPPPIQKTGDTLSSNTQSQAYKDAEVVLKQGVALLAKAASAMRQQSPFDPVPYRLSRISAWIPVDSLPTATGGKTMLPPPDEQIISVITRLYSASDWQNLVDACESRVQQYLFWLDLSRYVFEAMENLGYQDICASVATETAIYAKRLKGIENLSFSDGTPFADIETKEWLKNIISGSKGLGISSKASGALDSLTTQTHGDEQSHGLRDGRQVHRIALEISAAEKMVLENRIDEALSYIMASKAASRSERERFLWKLGLCKILISAKQIVIASSYVDDILQGVETFNLKSWEPEIAVDALSIALTILRLQQNEGNEQKIASIIKEISLLDPIKALNII
ncbi:hypothetical protein MTBBW1_80216 [Desulfamplus magnetovallimortis]|uniref:ImpA N-terminal domain-containing protein n=1 Tax=Desulfamplus magnetovallimortis TaxID=1246637 RepID=L0R5L9_9BACT|nr:TssA family type VI secretion system protein [Desulfamplus magnetovallimortis]CCO06822.1 hypothetical protein DEMABW1_80216 [Desulfamplus magnetovallimortis BW-1]SLM32873.1 hypothetical protein MTBBW1_80216 [Desulfamplus magnetovallimortis]